MERRTNRGKEALKVKSCCVYPSVPACVCVCVDELNPHDFYKRFSGLSLTFRITVICGLRSVCELLLYETMSPATRVI